MAMDIIFILLHTLLFLLNYTVFKRKILHPSILFSLIWVSILLVHLFLRYTILDELYPLNIDTYAIFFIGGLSFTAGSIMATFFYEKHKAYKLNNSVTSKNTYINTHVRIFLLIVLVVFLPIYIRSAFRLFIASGIDNFFIGLRTELNYGEEDIGPTKYLVSLSAVCYAINFYYKIQAPTKFNKLILYSSFIITITYSVFATGRLFFLIILSVYFGISYVFKSGFSLKKYSWAIIAFVIFFMATGVYYGKGGDTENTFKENVIESTKFLGIYLVSSLSAFDLELKSNNNNPSNTYPGANTLRFFIKIAQSLGLAENKEIVNLNRDFVSVPYPTNVFTFYSVYVNDWGRLYAWIVLFIIGALHTLIFNKALQTKSFKYTFYYSILLFPLLVSFFSDMYFTIFSTWIQFFVFLEITIGLQKVVIDLAIVYNKKNYLKGSGKKDV